MAPVFLVRPVKVLQLYFRALHLPVAGIGLYCRVEGGTGGWVSHVRGGAAAARQHFHRRTRRTYPPTANFPHTNILRCALRAQKPPHNMT